MSELRSRIRSHRAAPVTAVTGRGSPVAWPRARADRHRGLGRPRLALQRGLQRLHEAAQQRLEVEAARLDGQLARFEYLPSLLETSPDVLRAARRRRPMRHCASRSAATCKALNAIAGADNLYVLDRSGIALAAADFEQPGHARRAGPVVPALHARCAGARARRASTAWASRAARAGYYLSYALPARGALAASPRSRSTSRPIEQEWRDLPGEVLVLDEQQVVILASRDSWKYHPLAPLSADARPRPTQARRYGSAELAPLDWQMRERIGERATRVRHRRTAYLVSERAVNRRPMAAGAARRRGAGARGGPHRRPSVPALGAAVLLLAATLAVSSGGARSGSGWPTAKRCRRRTTRSSQGAGAHRRAARRAERARACRQARGARADVGGHGARAQPAAGRAAHAVGQRGAADRQRAARRGARQPRPHRPARRSAWGA